MPMCFDCAMVHDEGQTDCVRLPSPDDGGPDPSIYEEPAAAPCGVCHSTEEGPRFYCIGLWLCWTCARQGTRHPSMMIA